MYMFRMSSVQEDFMHKLLDASNGTHQSVFLKANELDRLMVAYMLLLRQMIGSIHDNGTRMTPEERSTEFKKLYEQYETAIDSRRVALCNIIESEVRIPARKTKWLGWIASQFAFFETKKEELKSVFVPKTTA